MLPLRLKTRPNSLLKLSAMSLVVATLSGCGEYAKDCGGFWDKTFGREECAVATPQNTTAPIIQTPVISTISPSQPTVGEQTTFTLTGQYLTNDLQLALADCDNLQITSRSSSQIVFGCKPAVKGLHTVELKQNTNVIADFSLEFQQTGEILRVKESKAEDVVQNSLGMEVIKGQLVVMANDDITPEHMAILAQKYKMKVVGQVDLVNMYQLEGDLTVEQLEQTKKELEQEAGVLNVKFNGYSEQQDYTLGEPFSTDDTELTEGDDEWDDTVLSDEIGGEEWPTFTDFEDVNPRNWHLRYGRVPNAWQRLKDMGADSKFVAVGVIDSGFRLNHQDLEMTKFQLSGVGGSYEPNKKSDHGMHVAGIIGATVNNKIGIAGVAGLTGTAVYGYRYSNSDIGILAGVVWAANKGVKVINMSVGNNHSPNEYFNNRLEFVVNERASFGLFLAQLLKKRDVLIIQAAGNMSDNCGPAEDHPSCISQNFPADLNFWAGSLKSDWGSIETRNKLNNDIAKILEGTDLQGQTALEWVRNHTLVVGSLAHQGQDQPIGMSKFSNGGNVVDVFAPGSNIYSLSDESDIGYMSKSGTSMAAPYVSGVAALALKANPSLSAMQLKWLLAWPEGRRVMQHWICDYTKITNKSTCDAKKLEQDDGQKRSAGFIQISKPIIDADRTVYDASVWTGVPVAVANGKFEVIGVTLGCKGNEAYQYQLNGAMIEVYSVLNGQKNKLIASSPTVLLNLNDNATKFLLPVDERYVFRIKKGTQSPLELDSRSFLVTKDKPIDYKINVQDDKNNCEGELTQDEQRYHLRLRNADDQWVDAPQSVGETTPSITTTPASPIVNTETSFSLVDTIFDSIKSIVWKFGQEIVEVFDNFGNAIKHIFNTLGEATVSATLKDQTGKEVATATTKVVVTALVCPEGQIEQGGKCIDTTPVVFEDNFNDNINGVTAGNWTAVVEGTNPSVQEANQRLEVTLPANSLDSSKLVFEAGYQSTCQLQGDFDVQVDYDLLDFPSYNGARVGLTVGDRARQSNTLYTVHRTSFSSHDAVSAREELGVNFTNTFGGVDVAGNTKGALRLQRVGNTLYGYGYLNGGWQLLDSNTITTNALPVTISAWGNNGYFDNKNVKVAFDNFKVTKGKLVGDSCKAKAVSRSYSVQWDFPQIGTPVPRNTTVNNPILITVGSGVESTNFMDIPKMDVDFSGNVAKFYNFRPYPDAYVSAFESTTNFNGIVLRSPAGQLRHFVSAKFSLDINGDGDFSDVGDISPTSSRMTVTNEYVAVNLQGLPHSSQTIIQIEFEEESTQPTWTPNPANGHQYAAVDCGTWTQCEAQAVALGGHLASVNDAAENAWLVSTFTPTKNYWIGLTDKDQEGVWKWTSGEAFGYSNWRSGQPDNWNGSSTESFVHMNYHTSDTHQLDGKWNDVTDFAGFATGLFEKSPNTFEIPIGTWTAWTGSKYLASQVKVTPEYITNATSNWGALRVRLPQMIDGDNFKVEFRAKNDPSLGGTWKWDLGFQVSNDFSSGKLSAAGIETPTKYVSFTMTNGYYPDFFGIASDSGEIGRLNQSGAINTRVWHNYVLTAKDHVLSLYSDGVLMYQQNYTGTVGMLDTFSIGGKNNLQLDAASLKFSQP